jgi:hypothetical protein
MIMMRFCIPSPTSRLSTARLLAVVALGTAAIASCGVDQSGLGSMPFLPHDASSSGTGGVAGTTGTPGSAGASSPGSAGIGGTGGDVVSGAAGSGTAGTAGDAGAAGVGGDNGSAGTGGNGNQGNSGSNGNAGNAGSNGNSGTAGNNGNAGAGGTAGDAAGTAGNDGTAGSGGATGNPGTAGSTGGAAGDTAGTAGAAGSGGVGGNGGRGGFAGNGLAGHGGTGGTGGTIPCNANTCSNGCCKDSFTCIRMRSAMQCGSNGDACAPCGGCQICSPMGQCQIDPMSRWTIVAESAQLKPGMWDPPSGQIGGPLPDPFCEYENPAGQVTTTTAGVTDTIVDTLNPTWNQVISPANMTVAASTLMATNPTWQIWVGDDDGCATPRCLADVACTIRQPITAAQMMAGQAVFTNLQMCNSVTIDFVCKP